MCRRCVYVAMHLLDDKAFSSTESQVCINLTLLLIWTVDWHVCLWLADTCVYGLLTRVFFCWLTRVFMVGWHVWLWLAVTCVYGWRTRVSMVGWHVCLWLADTCVYGWLTRVFMVGWHVCLWWYALVLDCAEYVATIDNSRCTQKHK